MSNLKHVVCIAWSVLLCLSRPSQALQVTEEEALAVAEFWYAREISASTTKLPLVEKQQRLADKNIHSLHYVNGRDDLTSERKADVPVAAYVVSFPSDHFAAIVQSIRGMLPTILSNVNHTVVASGYRDSVSPYFWLNGGHNGTDDGWYCLDALGWGDTTIDRSYPYMAPDIYRYVDGEERDHPDGKLQLAFETLQQALDDVPEGTDYRQIWMKAGTYTAPAIIDKGVTLKAYNQGAVVLTR